MYRFMWRQFFESGWAYLSSFIRSFDCPPTPFFLLIFGLFMVVLYCIFQPRFNEAWGVVGEAWRKKERRRL